MYFGSRRCHVRDNKTVQVTFDVAAATAVANTAARRFVSRSLQELLNFQAHHLHVNPILVVSHSLHR